MSADMAMLRAMLHRTLNMFGRDIGQEAPHSASNIDGILHEFFITNEAVSYFKARHDKAREQALDAALNAGELASAVDRVTEMMQGESLVAATGEHYQMVVEIAKPAMRLNAAQLKNTLVVDFGWTREAVDQLIDASSTLSAPAKRIKIVST